MKSTLKIIGLIITLAALLLVLKYLIDTSYNGTQSISIMNHNDELQNIQELIKMPQFAGKVLYIDIWGVYCKPCIAQFKYLPDLKTTLEGKEIVFIYLATKYGHIHDEQLWKNKIRKHDLQGLHLLIDSAFYESIWEIPGIEGKYQIPHYLIIDKKGNVAFPNAACPSNKRPLIAQLEKVL